MSQKDVIHYTHRTLVLFLKHIKLYKKFRQNIYNDEIQHRRYGNNQDIQLPSGISTAFVWTETKEQDDWIIANRLWEKLNVYGNLYAKYLTLQKPNN